MAKITRIHLDVQKTCRTCLSQNVRNRNLFLKENDIQLADILRTMTIIELAENDGLPQNVCESCAEKLLQIQEFKRSCKTVDKILKEYCDTKKYLAVDEDEHNKIEEIITETTHDSIEGQDEETLTETYVNFKMEYVQDEEELTNMMISDQVVRENKIHIGEEQVSELPNLKSASLQRTDIIVDHLRGYVEMCCHICYKKFKTKYGLNRHLKIHMNGQYACVPCGNKFSTRRELALHNKCTHGQVSSYQCTQCNMHFARHFNLVMHNREHHVNCEMEIKEDYGGVIIQLKEDFNGDQQAEDPLKMDGGYSQEYVTSVNGKTRKIYPCPTCGKVYISKIGLQRHERLHTGERPYLCTYCGKRFLMNTDLISHVRLHTGDCPYVCKACGKAYTKRFYLQQHEKSHNKNKFQCIICSTEYDTVSQLQRHQLLHENCSAEEKEKNVEEIENDGDTAVVYREVHKCLVCSKLYAHSHSLKEHMKSHEDRERLICDICGQTFRTAKTLKRHVKHHTESPQIRCHLCPKMFYSVFERNNHLVSHTESRPFLCTTCGMTFKTSPQLKIHNRVHTDERPYRCTICPKSFKQSATMHDHILTHSDDMVYPCKLCDKVYTKKGSYKSHVRMHKEDYKQKNHVCNICGKRFPLGTMLNSHMLTHADGNLKCPQCPKVFRSKRHLNNHISTHTKDKMTTCPICGKGISRSSKLPIHMRTHTGERPYVCTVCGKGCTTSTMLKVHLQTHSNKKRIENVEKT